MGDYEMECAEVFLKEQDKLFPMPVAETLEEAIAFLEDCFATVLDSLKEVREYMEESGMDIDGMSDEDLKEQAEVFILPSGKYMVVEA